MEGFATALGTSLQDVARPTSNSLPNPTDTQESLRFQEGSNTKTKYPHDAILLFERAL